MKRHRSSPLRFLLCGSVAILSLSSSVAQAAVTTETHGPRSVRVFVPTKPASPLSMVVMLHGCTQEANGFADATQMDAIAEEKGFVAVYPDQPSSVTPTKCWQWWEPAHQARDAGEPKDLADAVSAIAAAKGVDAQRVYVAGISAGGAMSTILGATYPDRFAAIGVVAGLEYKATTSFGGILEASSKGGPDPNVQADLVYTAMGARGRAVPAIVFHGTVDSVVAKVNGDQVAAMWLGIAQRGLGAAAVEAGAPVTATAGYPFTWTPQLVKAKGSSVVEHYVVEGLGHAWPGGKAGGSYSDAKGPNASRLIWSFFSGRTIAAPIDVAPPAPPASSSSSSSSGGASSGSSGATSSGDPAPEEPVGSSGSSGSSSDSGGCAVIGSRSSSGGECAALGVVALAHYLRRRRSAIAGRRR